MAVASFTLAGETNGQAANSSIFPKVGLSIAKTQRTQEAARPGARREPVSQTGTEERSLFGLGLGVAEAVSGTTSTRIRLPVSSTRPSGWRTMRASLPTRAGGGVIRPFPANTEVRLPGKRRTRRVTTTPASKSMYLVESRRRGLAGGGVRSRLSPRRPASVAVACAAIPPPRGHTWRRSRPQVQWTTARATVSASSTGGL